MTAGSPIRREDERNTTRFSALRVCRVAATEAVTQVGLCSPFVRLDRVPLAHCCNPTSVQSTSRQSQRSRVLQAPSRTVGFTRRFHTLSSVQATNNTSLAIVPQSPVVVHTSLHSRALGQTASIKDCRPLGCDRAAVAVRLARSPPNKAIRVHSPAESLRIFACGNRDGRCRWSAGFLGDLPFPPPFHSGAAPYSLQSPSSALKTSMSRAVQIASLALYFSYVGDTHRDKANGVAGNTPSCEQSDLDSLIGHSHVAPHPSRHAANKARPVVYATLSSDPTSALAGNNDSPNFVVAQHPGFILGDGYAPGTIQNHEISLVQHFYTGSKIKLDPDSELGSFDFGSGMMLVQPGITVHLSKVNAPRLEGEPGTRNWLPYAVFPLVANPHLVFSLLNPTPPSPHIPPATIVRWIRSASKVAKAPSNYDAIGVSHCGNMFDYVVFWNCTPARGHSSASLASSEGSNGASGRSRVRTLCAADTAPIVCEVPNVRPATQQRTTYVHKGCFTISCRSCYRELLYAVRVAVAVAICAIKICYFCSCSPRYSRNIKTSKVEKNGFQNKITKHRRVLRLTIANNCTSPYPPALKETLPAIALYRARVPRMTTEVEILYIITNSGEHFPTAQVFNNNFPQRSVVKHSCNILEWAVNSTVAVKCVRKGRPAIDSIDRVGVDVETAEGGGGGCVYLPHQSRPGTLLSATACPAVGWQIALGGETRCYTAGQPQLAIPPVGDKRQVVTSHVPTGTQQRRKVVPMYLHYLFTPNKKWLRSDCDRNKFGDSVTQCAMLNIVEAKRACLVGGGCWLADYVVLPPSEGSALPAGISAAAVVALFQKEQVIPRRSETIISVSQRQFLLPLCKELLLFSIRNLSCGFVFLWIARSCVDVDLQAEHCTDTPCANFNTPFQQDFNCRRIFKRGRGGAVNAVIVAESMFVVCLRRKLRIHGNSTGARRTFQAVVAYPEVFSHSRLVSAEVVRATLPRASSVPSPLRAGPRTDVRCSRSAARTCRTSSGALIILLLESVYMLFTVKRNRWNERLEEADEACKKNKSRAFLREMKSRIKVYEAREPFVKGRDGGLKIGGKDACEEMARYFKDLLNTDVPTGRMTLHFTKNINCGRVPSRAEVVKAIKDLKANKAAGDDGICAEEIKWGDLVTREHVQNNNRHLDE
ncbi:hypothetical protein PR048_003613 [Dryococelus australis]|uniref:Uncharacterized protein n=1 Tax=Dryococelus australis TaxID=614101 RepID=A0ABQ9IQE5_9NEOP|nr:hypothetical protein PR048_003613 [Dryococelus australis]